MRKIECFAAHYIRSAAASQNKDDTRGVSVADGDSTVDV
jgi:hypothetical protein